MIVEKGDHITRLINIGDEIRDNIIRILGSGREYSYPNKKQHDKSRLLTAYFNLAIDFQKGIHFLISKNCCPSASALVRPLSDTYYRFLWVDKCAGEMDIERITNNPDYRFPAIVKMLSALDKAFGSNVFKDNIILTAWNAMHGYTHPGLHQLGRQLLDNGDVGTNFTDDEKSEILESSNMIILLMAFFFSMSFDMKAEAERFAQKVFEFSNK
jgi:hypothetical protein